jgi:hypothetical protein
LALIHNKAKVRAFFIRLLGGTSAAAPLWATANLLIDQEGNTRYGLLNPILYQLATEFNPASGFFFHDITSGNNGAYSCTPNYDLVTGWGSANFGWLGVDMTTLPDYTPYNPGYGGPAGTWTSPIMIDTSATAVGEPSSFDDATTYYFAIAVQDLGPADAPGSTADIQIDGVDNPVTLGPIAVNGVWYSLNGLQTNLSGGSHTIKLIANYNNAVKEGNTSNNTYSRTINVLSSVGTLSGISLSLPSVNGGLADAGTVSISAAAIGDTTISLTSSNKTVLTVPSTVTVPAGQTSVTFQASTSAVKTATNVTITASFNGVTKTTTVTVGPAPKLSVLSVTPTAVAGGTNATGTVTLSGNTYSPLTVTLTSGNTSLFTVPASVTVLAGAKTATFAVTTIPISANAASKVTATLGTASSSSSLEVLAPALVSVAMNPSSVQGGQNSTGTVTVSSVAPAGGMPVTLSSYNSAARVPSSITIAAGATTATFTVNTTQVSAGVAATISAVMNNVKVKGTLTIATPPSVSSVAISPTKFYGGQTATGTVTLKSNTLANTVVALSSTNPSVAKPQQTTVTIPANSNSATFTVTSSPVAGNTILYIVAKVGTGGNSSAIEVWTPTVSSVTFNPSSVHGGQSSTGTVTLTGAAPTGGLTVTLASNNTAAATVPATMIIPAGRTSGTFTVTTVAVAQTTSAKITATANGTSVNTKLTITH